MNYLITLNQPNHWMNHESWKKNISLLNNYCLSVTNRKEFTSIGDENKIYFFDLIIEY